jgi:hypothetical protein
VILAPFLLALLFDRENTDDILLRKICLFFKGFHGVTFQTSGLYLFRQNICQSTVPVVQIRIARDFNLLSAAFMQSAYSNRVSRNAWK